MFGLSDDDYNSLDKLLIQPLKKWNCRIWVFGSRARGDQQRFSDIDVLYEIPSEVNLPPGFISEIKEGLEESDLPMKVDLVNIHDLAESYKQNILQERVEV